MIGIRFGIRIFFCKYPNIKPEINQEKAKKKSKAVNSSISVDMLSVAYENQFDIVEIWTGGADHLPLISVVKRLGKVVICCCFGKKYGLSHELKVVHEHHCDISELMEQRWKAKQPEN